MSKINNPEIPLDPRFKSKQFCHDARRVLTHYGYDYSRKAFAEFDALFPISPDYHQMAMHLDNPSYEARVRCKAGNTTIVALPGATKSEAIKHLDTKLYSFLDWW